MATIPQVTAAMERILTTVAEEAGQDTGFVRRPSRSTLTGSTFTQTLVFGWLADPDATLEQLAGTASRLGVDISPQALDQRFTVSGAACLRQVLDASVAEVLAHDPVALPVLQRFTGVWVQDSTTITLPDALAATFPSCGGGAAATPAPAAAMKCGVQLDLLTGALHGPSIASGRTADTTLPCQTAALPPGSLRLADLGFFDLGVLAELAAAGVSWLSRVRTTIQVGLTADGAPASLRTVIETGLAAGGEQKVWLGVARVPARLLVQSVPQEVADQRRRRIRKAAQDKGRMPNADALALAAWTILITNVPADQLSVAEALVVATARWQIELLFKLWKSHGQVDTWRSQQPQRILCEVYAKLIALVIQHWLLLVSCWAYPDRSLVKAAQAVRTAAPELASAFGVPALMTRAIAVLQRQLRRLGRLNPRKTDPNTVQLLLDLTATADYT